MAVIARAGDAVMAKVNIRPIICDVTRVTLGIRLYMVGGFSGRRCAVMTATA